MGRQYVVSMLLIISGFFLVFLDKMEFAGYDIYTISSKKHTGFLLCCQKSIMYQIGSGFYPLSFFIDQSSIKNTW